MRRTAILALILAAALVGCNKPKGPQTTELSPSPMERPVEQLMPAPAPAPVPIEVAQEPTPVDDAPPPLDPTGRTHLLRKGDTLWSLSKTYLGDPKRWQEIVALNPGIRANALPVGKAIMIPQK